MDKKKDIQKKKQNLIAKTPEAQENIMISLAIDLAAKQLEEGTASSQVITHFLKLGTTREKTEREILELEKKLIQAKTDSLESSKKVETLYLDALKAMKLYQGDVAEEEPDE